MAIENVELMHECFPDLFLQENSKYKIRQMHRGRMSEEKSEYGWKKISPDDVTELGPTVPSWSLLPEAVDELPNELNLLI